MNLRLHSDELSVCESRGSRPSGRARQARRGYGSDARDAHPGSAFRFPRSEVEVSLSACRVRAEYVDKHVRSIWTLPDIISTDSYAWALGLAPGGNVQRATTVSVTSARGDPIILSVATGVEGATASIGSTLKLPNSIYTQNVPKKALVRFRIVPRVALRARGLVGSVFVSLFL